MRHFCRLVTPQTWLARSSCFSLPDCTEQVLHLRCFGALMAAVLVLHSAAPNCISRLLLGTLSQGFAAALHDRACAGKCRRIHLEAALALPIAVWPLHNRSLKRIPIPCPKKVVTSCPVPLSRPHNVAVCRLFMWSVRSLRPHSAGPFPQQQSRPPNSLGGRHAAGLQLLLCLHQGTGACHATYGFYICWAVRL